MLVKTVQGAIPVRETDDKINAFGWFIFMELLSLILVLLVCRVHPAYQTVIHTE